MKKILALSLTLAMASTFAVCGATAIDHSNTLRQEIDNLHLTANTVEAEYCSSSLLFENGFSLDNKNDNYTLTNDTNTNNRTNQIRDRDQTTNRETTTNNKIANTEQTRESQQTTNNTNKNGTNNSSTNRTDNNLIAANPQGTSPYGIGQANRGVLPNNTTNSNSNLDSMVRVNNIDTYKNTTNSNIDGRVYNNDGAVVGTGNGLNTTNSNIKNITPRQNTVSQNTNSTPNGISSVNGENGGRVIIDSSNTSTSNKITDNTSSLAPSRNNRGIAPNANSAPNSTTLNTNANNSLNIDELTNKNARATTSPSASTNYNTTSNITNNSRDNRLSTNYTVVDKPTVDNTQNQTTNYTNKNTTTTNSGNNVNRPNTINSATPQNNTNFSRDKLDTVNQPFSTQSNSTQNSNNLKPRSSVFNNTDTTTTAESTTTLNNDYSVYQNKITELNSRLSTINATVDDNLKIARQNIQRVIDGEIALNDTQAEQINEYSRLLKKITHKLTENEFELMHSAGKIALANSMQNNDKNLNAVYLDMQYTLTCREHCLNCANDAISAINAVFLNITIDTQDSSNVTDTTTDLQNTDNATNYTQNATQSAFNKSTNVSNLTTDKKANNNSRTNI